MNSYDVTRDRYEDTLLERLMEAVRLAQGQAALAENERLKEDPDAAVPGELNEKCRRIIRKGYHKGQLRSSGRTTLRVVSRVALIAAILMVTFAVAFAASPAVREATSSWIVKTFEDHTDIVSSPKPEIGPDQTDSRRAAFENLTVRAGWLPDHFEQITAGENEDQKWVVYKEPSGCTFEVNVHYTVGGQIDVHFQWPYNEMEQIEIRGMSATLLPVDGDYFIVWSLDEYGADVHLTCSGVSRTEALMFAQNLLFD